MPNGDWPSDFSLQGPSAGILRSRGNMNSPLLPPPLTRGFSHTLSATRLHFPADTKCLPESAREQLRNFAIAAKELGIAAAIAVSAFEDTIRQVLAEAAPGLDVEVLHIPVWGAFVPALNALLYTAQQRGMKYILYHSLEVKCKKLVLRKLLDHHQSPGVLVAGPVLDGHVFEAGEQPLNGRSTPWNTLAVWNVRKLALTGFLNIADGLPAVERQMTRQIVGDSDEENCIGSVGWWSCTLERQKTEEICVPAGVEEVTAIALLQHLLGKSHARAILTKLPAELDKMFSWKTTWGQDARRTQWHEYKMQSKVTRPNAQMGELFGNFRGMKKIKSYQSMLGSSDEEAPRAAEPHVKFGTVLHFGESIKPAKHVEYICLVSIALFCANFASAFAPAFLTLNGNGAHEKLPDVIFLSVLLGGVFIPMPLSIRLIRQITLRANHISGIIFFLITLIASNGFIVLWQLDGRTSVGRSQQLVVLAARLFQGLGSGVLFQARIILASVSTEDRHLSLQIKQFLAADLGLGIGALLPAFTATLTGASELNADAPELLTSALLTVVCSVFVWWVIIAFPKHLHFLPSSVRFPTTSSEKLNSPERSRSKASSQPVVTELLISGTARVFVQSASIMTVGLFLRDEGYTGSFRQSMAVGLLCLIPVPLEVMGTRLVKRAVTRDKWDRSGGNKLATWMVVFIMSIAMVGGPMALLAAWFLLILGLALIAPSNVTRLNQLRDSERSMILLEWLKSYIGRLLGPLFAMAVYNEMGCRPLLVLLGIGTIIVARTA